MYKYLASFIGVLITIMISLNGMLSELVNSSISLIIIHTTGLITVSIILILKKEKFHLEKNTKLYLYTGGLLGVFMVLFSNLAVINIGASLTISLGVLGQVIISTFVDHFGVLGMEKYPFNKEKILGFSFIIIGIIVMAKF